MIREKNIEIKSQSGNQMKSKKIQKLKKSKKENQT